MSENVAKSETEKQLFRDRPYLIGISGGSGGGKTSVANVLHRCLGQENCLLFSMDTYYKDLTPEQEKNLSNYDLDLLSEHLSALMQWKSIEMPTYDFNTNKRQKETLHLNPNKFIIFEGILAFHDKRMRDLMDLKLFIDLDDDIRLSRRIYRDIISSWTAKDAKVDDVTLYELTEHVLTENTNKIEETLNNALQSMSFMDEYENFYHGYILGLFVYFMNRDYIVKSNREAGEGRFDLMIERIDRTLGIVIEFKLAKDNEDLEQKAQEGKKQIIEREYYKELELDRVEKILTYSIAFKGKKCVVR